MKNNNENQYSAIDGRKVELYDAIINQIKNENPSYSEEILHNVRVRLSNATDDEVERLYDAFRRFGVNTILEAIE